AREQGDALGLHGQADDDPEEPRLQRVVLRLLDLLETARGGRQAEDRHARTRREERHVHHHRPLRGRTRGLSGGTRLGAAALGLALLAAPAAPAQVVDPAMVRGPADAPVTIVEFADYQ